MKKIYIHTSLIFLFFLAFSAQALGQDQSNPNSAKACALCHYRWIETFFVEGRGTDLVEYQSEKVVATPDMCFSCHDGSIRDSRAKLSEDTGHKINRKPPGNMQIPEIFPLDEKGRMQCSTCHTAHGVQGVPGSGETIFMRTSNKDSAMCRMCHPAADGGMAEGNHPAGITQRQVPEKLFSLGGLGGGNKNRIICQTCHAAHGSPYESFLIDGAGNSALCLDCHEDKNIFGPQGTRRPMHVINVPPQKAKIPAELINQGAKTGYQGSIICLTCHKVHYNKTQEKFLLIMGNEKSSLCLTCHVDKEYLVSSKHNLIKSAPGEKNLQGKTAAEEGICSPCHLPHKPARNLRGEEDFTTQLCLSCHSTGNVGDKVMPQGYSHPLDVSPFDKKAENPLVNPTDAEEGKLALPLFNRYNVQDENGRLTCLTCHEPHGLPANSTKELATKEGAGPKFNPLLRENSPDICRQCHRSKFAIVDSKHDLDKLTPQEKDILRSKGPEPGICGNCHLVHGPERAYLWTREDSSKTQGNRTEELCTACHNERGLASKKVVKGYSHPLNISPAEKGLTTTLPLYNGEGKISADGVLTCPTCHDPHRGNLLRVSQGEHLNPEVDSQNRFLRLENSPSPTLCENCHPKEARVEKTDHDLSITAPAHKNIMGETPAQSGTCGVCHLVHNSKEKIRLWAQELGPGTDVMARMCNSCHSASGSANNKVPPVAYHPQESLVDLSGKIKRGENYLPLFDPISGDPVVTGNISCPSCHNAHQWDPKRPAKGEGVNLEGNATNSFLRTNSPDLMCKDCHGFQALFKFKFFHDPVLRKVQGITFPFR
jgi:predicted CXXCH cytochrome family protein